ncbi:hypothetical protein K2Y00_03085 [Patescibacteria group bacterium]|nr:hypothetical protein [Patescibacteria group bacterium]
MALESFSSAETGPLSKEEIAAVFEEARVMNLLFPQAIQGIAMVMIGELLNSPNPERMLRRFASTRLPEPLAEKYGDHGTAAHIARGFTREVGALGGAWLWEREKVTLFAILARVFLSREDRQQLHIDSPRIKEIGRMLQHVIHSSGKFEDGPQFNEAGITELCKVLSARMSADKEGVAALQAYAPLVKEALETLTDKLTVYREGFAPIVKRRDLTGDIHTYFAQTDAHVRPMLDQALDATETLLKEKEMPQALKRRVELLINILKTQYFEH